MRRLDCRLEGDRQSGILYLMWTPSQIRGPSKKFEDRPNRYSANKYIAKLLKTFLFSHAIARLQIESMQNPSLLNIWPITFISYRLSDS